jgi:hypothetical protein
MLRGLLAGSVLLVAACSGTDAECVIDTDCPLFQRCARQKCVSVGGGPAPRDAGREGGSGEGGVRDGATEGGPIDGSRSDATDDDAMSSDAPACPDLVGSYAVTSISGSCADLAMSAAVMVTVGSDPCLVGFSGAIAGGGTVGPEGDLIPPLTIMTSGGTMLTCAGSFTGGTISLNCTPDCLVALTRM